MIRLNEIFEAFVLSTAPEASLLIIKVATTQYTHIHTHIYKSYSPGGYFFLSVDVTLIDK